MYGVWTLDLPLNLYDRCKPLVLWQACFRSSCSWYSLEAFFGLPGCFNCLCFLHRWARSQPLVVIFPISRLWPRALISCVHVRNSQVGLNLGFFPLTFLVRLGWVLEGGCVVTTLSTPMGEFRPWHEHGRALFKMYILCALASVPRYRGNPFNEQWIN